MCWGFANLRFENDKERWSTCFEKGPGLDVNETTGVIKVNPWVRIPPVFRHGIVRNSTGNYTVTLSDDLVFTTMIFGCYFLEKIH